MPRTGGRRRPCEYDYILVVDFEATCEEPQTRTYVAEIIDFPIVVIDTQRRIVAEFHSFCRPQRHPTLTAFCIYLTRITQAQVAAAPTLREVVGRFAEWLKATIPAGKTVVLATDGPWDLRNYIRDGGRCDASRLNGGWLPSRPRWLQPHACATALLSRSAAGRGGRGVTPHGRFVQSIDQWSVSPRLLSERTRGVGLFESRAVLTSESV